MVAVDKLPIAVAIMLATIVVVVAVTAERTPPPQISTTRMSRWDKIIRASRKAMQRISAKSGDQDTLYVTLGDPGQEYEAVRGHDVDMTCGDDLAMKVNWYHNAERIDENTFVEWRFEVTNATNHLHIYLVEEGDAGDYECYSVDENGGSKFVGETKLTTISIWGALNPFG